MISFVQERERVIKNMKSFASFLYKDYHHQHPSQLNWTAVCYTFSFFLKESKWVKELERERQLRRERERGSKCGIVRVNGTCFSFWYFIFVPILNSYSKLVSESSGKRNERKGRKIVCSCSRFHIWIGMNNSWRITRKSCFQWEKKSRKKEKVRKKKG